MKLESQGWKIAACCEWPALSLGGYGEVPVQATAEGHDWVSGYYSHCQCSRVMILLENIGTFLVGADAGNHVDIQGPCRTGAALHWLQGSRELATLLTSSH